MKRRALSLALVLGISTVTWGYHITGISVTPANPTPTDSISITVSGWKPATNYSIQRSEVHIIGKTIMLDIYWQNPGCGGQIVTSYTRTECVGRLSAGTYTISVRSFLNCRVCDQMAKVFAVSSGSGCGCPSHICPGFHWLFPCPCHNSNNTTSSTSNSNTMAIGPSGAAVADANGVSTSGNSSSTSSSHSQSVAH